MNPSNTARDSAAPPCVFISYSHETPQHSQWVLDFASDLRRNGVNVILDRWDLKLGADKTAFMETSVVDSDFVLVICTDEYARKANSRAGGVGYEATIITGQLASHVDTTKFIPVLRQGDWHSAVPHWLKSRLGVDMRADPYPSASLEELLDTLHQQTLAPPPVGAYEAKTRTRTANQTSPQLEQAICSKAEADFQLLLERLDEAPYPEAMQQKLEDNIHREYAPKTVLVESFKIRTEGVLIPLAEARIRVEAELRGIHHQPFTPARVQTLSQQIRELVLARWENVVRSSFEDAMRHVESTMGRVPDYKQRELADLRDFYIASVPDGLFRQISKLLDAALAHSLVQKHSGNSV